MDPKIGNYAFLFGVLVAIVAAVGKLRPGLAVSLLVVLGIVVGILNITKKETMDFLVSSIALIVASNAVLGIRAVQNMALVSAILIYAIAFIAPAAIIVALKTVYELSKD